MTVLEVSASGHELEFKVGYPLLRDKESHHASAHDQVSTFLVATV